MNRALDAAFAGSGSHWRVRCSQPRRSRSSWTTAARSSTASDVSACDGEEFELVKLRTMEVGAEHQGAGSRSTRATRGSRGSAECLRRLSLSTSFRSSGTSCAAT